MKKYEVPELEIIEIEDEVTNTIPSLGGTGEGDEW